MPISGLSAAGRGAEGDRRIFDLVATVIERCGVRGEPGPGPPPGETVRVLATLRRFPREGTPWRSLRATSAQASGSTLRRRLADWAAVNLPQRVHAVLLAMLRGHPDLILDSCSVRAKGLQPKLGDEPGGGVSSVMVQATRKDTPWRKAPLSRCRSQARRSRMIRCSRCCGKAPGAC